MSPCPAINNMSNSMSMNTKQFSNLSKVIPLRMKLSDFINLAGIEFGLRVFLPLKSAVPSKVFPVGLKSIPSKITESVISRVTIVMTAFFPFWAWTYKCFKNKTMDIAKSCFVAISHVQMFMTTYKSIRIEFFPFLFSTPSFGVNISISTSTITRPIGNIFALHDYSIRRNNRYYNSVETDLLSQIRAFNEMK